MDIKNLTDTEKNFIVSLIKASYVHKGVVWRYIKKNEIGCTIEEMFQILVKSNPLCKTNDYFTLYVYPPAASEPIESVTIGDSPEYAKEFKKIFERVKKEKYEKETKPVLVSINSALDRLLETEHTINFPPPEPPVVQDRYAG